MTFEPFDLKVEKLISVTGDMLVEELKKKIEQEFQIKLNNQKLKSDCNVLESGNTLESYDISPRSTVFIMPLKKEEEQLIENNTEKKKSENNTQISTGKQNNSSTSSHSCISSNGHSGGYSKYLGGDEYDNHIKIVVIGDINAGKSTLSGHLIYKYNMGNGKFIRFSNYATP